MWYINYKTNEEVITMRDELLKGLTDEQIKKVEDCKSADEIIALAKAEGIELTDEQLEAVSGGGCFRKSKVKCPKCGADYKSCFKERIWTDSEGKGSIIEYRCLCCDYVWKQ